MNLQSKTRLKLKTWLIWPLSLSVILSSIVYLAAGKTQAMSMFFRHTYGNYSTSNFWFLLFSSCWSSTKSSNMARFCERRGFKTHNSCGNICAGFSLFVSDAIVVFAGFYTDAIYSIGNKLLVVESLRLGNNYDFKHRIY
jgi:hypothetical protein